MTALELCKSVAAAFMRALHWLWRRLQGHVIEVVGGTARTRVVVLFAGVLALSSAQISTVGAVAPQLEASLRLDNTKIGLLNSVTLLVAAVAVIPVGLLVDRIKRIPILSISIVLWSVATILGAIAGSYGTLLLTRVALGVVSATAGPAIASLTGDYFPSAERGRVYGYILTGEILGTAVGFVICGNVAGAFGWRASFWVLAIPGFFLARELWRTVPEPRRGGSSRLERGVVDLQDHHHDPTEERAASDREGADLAASLAEKQGYRPDPELVLDRDPNRMSLVEAIRYILRIPTNVWLIISSSLGYFFFSGLETFATVFVRGHFHVGQGEATLVLGVLVVGAVCGTLVAGPITDLLTRHGKVAARVWVPGVCNILAGLMLIPGLLLGSLAEALVFCFLGTALISAANPPLDAARLDIMPSLLWGRAESTRTFLRSIAQAIAPLAFGGVADLIVGFAPHAAPTGTHTGHVSDAAGNGLQVSFLIMLVSLLAAGYFLLRARESYPRDVATAVASSVPLSDRPPPRARRASRRDREPPVTVTDRRAAEATVVRSDEDPTVVRSDEDPTVVRSDEDPTVVRSDADDDPTVVRSDADKDPTVVRSDDADDDPTVVRSDADDDPTVVRSDADDDPTVVRPRDDDDTEPLFWPRDKR